MHPSDQGRDAAVGRPEGTVRAVPYPVAGEKTLRDLVAEAEANEKAFKAKVRSTSAPLRGDRPIPRSQ
jgi:hypothetical protein